MWSLGVEEQFYVLFPLLLVLIARYARNAVAIWVAVVVLTSLVLNAFLVKIGGALPAFYLLPARAWELGIGALVAFTPSGGARWRIPAGVLGAAGAVLVAFGLFAGPITSVPLLPDAVPAAAGTALLLWSGAGRRHWLARWLSWRPLVFVGLISYSLYLWHWPVIVLLKYYLVRDLGSWDICAALALMTGCAVLSWRYVERPFRSYSMPIVKVRYAALAGSIAAVVAGALITIAADGLPGRLNPAAAKINAAVGTNYRCAVSDYLYLAQSRACVLELPSRNPEDADVVVLGNSHAQMYAPVIQDVLRGLSLHGLLVPANGCLPTYNVNVDPQCLKLANRNIDAVVSLRRARVVIIGTTWSNRFAGAGNGAALPVPLGVLVTGLDATIDRFCAPPASVCGVDRSHSNSQLGRSFRCQPRFGLWPHHRTTVIRTTTPVSAAIRGSHRPF